MNIKSLMQHFRRHIIIKKQLDTAELIRKILIRTRPTNWMTSLDPIILPLSIHSQLNEGKEGSFKIAALISAIKSMDRKVTVLICEAAHLQTMSLQYNGDIEKARLVSRQDADEFVARFQHELSDCDVQYWHDLIVQNENYISLQKEIAALYRTDEEFQLKIKNDAIRSYTMKRQQAYPQKDSYLQRAELELMEKCTYLRIMAKLGYKFELYPGKRESSVEYINNKLLPESSRLTRVNVSLSTPKEISSS